jgi:glycosyltransferase involved in cell wall biosynthesis
MAARIGAVPETVFGYAARVEEGKGPLVLVDALAELNGSREPALVRMAGTGSQLPRVRARVRACALEDSCEFVGCYTETVGRSAFMRSLDVFILPSFAEGTPNSVIEAMAHGLPVIASRVGGLPDLISDESGILVAPGDVAALAEAMRLLASNGSLRESMGRAARQRYVNLFSRDAVLPLLEAAYLRVAASRGAQASKSQLEVLAHPWQVVPKF